MASSTYRDPKRFQASAWTLFVDRFMTHFIKLGGVLVIVAVFGIFVFILAQILPLFKGAHVEELTSVSVPPGKYKALGVDEWAEKPFLLREDGKFEFLDLSAYSAEKEAAKPDAKPASHEIKIIEVDPAFDLAPVEAVPLAGSTATPNANSVFTAINYAAEKQTIFYGTKNGFFTRVPIRYSPKFEAGKRVIIPSAKAEKFVPIGRPGFPIVDIDGASNESQILVAAVQRQVDRSELHAALLERKKSLMGSGDWKVTENFDLTGLLSGDPVHLLVDSSAEGIVVSTEEGEIDYFFRRGSKFELRQKFKPFEDLADKTIASLDFVFGDVSLVVTNQSGDMRVFSLYVHPGESSRTFGLTKTFPKMPAGASFYDASLRNKAFLTGEGHFATLRYSTTESVRWQKEMPFEIQLGILGPKFNRILFLDSANTLHVYRLEDEHPEASFQGLFGKVWYEGYPAPAYEWQSTGGSDDFEPKFSLIPLIIGTLKGTFYAMLFAVPIALLAAIYTSQFLHPRYKAVVKPTMEIMASLPSVVLGFLAALWLAPILDTRVPSVLCMVVSIPVTAFGFGYAWNQLPIRYRNLIKAGYEFWVFLPMLLVVGWGAWNLGPVVERLLFVVTDPETGKQTADFRLWWPSVTGASFDQRNSLVVGFMMGFAVIPIIFTIAEDSLSNVPGALRSASLALGASRWQTAIRVVVPTASPGIFSALMIGLGRAVGETMIVVMATGNTPVMDFNIFSGMRTLSANIAVELPEAPQFGTLYRTLFLGAMLLFLMTFFVNTVAEVMRQYLRDKYKTV